MSVKLAVREPAGAVPLKVWTGSKLKLNEACATPVPAARDAINSALERRLFKDCFF